MHHIIGKTEMTEIKPERSGTNKEHEKENPKGEVEEKPMKKEVNIEVEKEKPKGEVEEKPIKKKANMEQGKEKPEGEVEEKPIKKEAKIEEEEVTVPVVKEEDVLVELEPKTGISFPVMVAGKQLNSVGVRKKSVLGLGIKIYGFGIYADNDKIKDLLRAKIGKAPTKATKEMYTMVIDSDFGMLVRLVIVFSNLTMSMVRKNFDESIGASIKKLTGRKDEKLAKMIMGEASDNIKLKAGSIIEISRLQGFTLQTKVRGEIVSTVQSEIICRAFVNMYLGEDPFDKEAKEKFGTALLSMF